MKVDAFFFRLIEIKRKDQKNMVKNDTNLIERLKSIQGEKQNVSSMTKFENLVAVYVGTEPVKHYPKMRDKNGNKVQDEKGNDIRSEQSDGYTYTFVEYMTARTLKVVLDGRYDVEPLGVYSVTGFGYDIKQSRMIFLEKETSIVKY